MLACLLILTHNLSTHSSLSPRQSSIHSSLSAMWLFILLSILLERLICFSGNFLQSPAIIILVFILQTAFTQNANNIKYWNILLWLMVLVTLMDKGYTCNSMQSWDASLSHPALPYSFFGTSAPNWYPSWFICSCVGCPIMTKYPFSSSMPQNCTAFSGQTVSLRIRNHHCSLLFSVDTFKDDKSGKNDLFKAEILQHRRNLSIRLPLSWKATTIHWKKNRSKVSEEISTLVGLL